MWFAWSPFLITREYPCTLFETTILFYRNKRWWERGTECEAADRAGVELARIIPQALLHGITTGIITGIALLHGAHD